MIARADVLIQNLAPGAAARAGFGAADLRERHPRLITVDISGYGDIGPYASDARLRPAGAGGIGSGVITGQPAAPGRVGISATDIGSGMYAHAAVLEALLERGDHRSRQRPAR